VALKTYPLEYGDAFDAIEDQASLLSDALASGKPEAVTGALRIIAKARGMSETAEAAGLSREAMSRDGTGREPHARDTARDPELGGAIAFGRAGQAAEGGEPGEEAGGVKRTADWPETRYEQKAAREGRVRYYFRWARV